jgi:hypothetical protein
MQAKEMCTVSGNEKGDMDAGGASKLYRQFHCGDAQRSSAGAGTCFT